MNHSGVSIWHRISLCLFHFFTVLDGICAGWRFSFSLFFLLERLVNVMCVWAWTEKLLRHCEYFFTVAVYMETSVMCVAIVNVGICSLTASVIPSEKISRKRSKRNGKAA